VEFKGDYSSHISQQFNEELEQIRTLLLTMGGIVERQVHDAVEALLSGDTNLAEQSRKTDTQTNEMEILIDEQIATTIARRQPAASDLRLIISVSKAVTSLERMGDEASRICRHAIELSEAGQSPRGYQEVRHIGNLVREMVKNVLTAFARNDTELAYKVAKMDKSVDQEYRSAMRSLATFMMEDPRSISSIMNVIWVLRSLERMGDHARSMAQQLIYMVSGTDVRHTSLQNLKQAAVQNGETEEEEEDA